VPFQIQINYTRVEDGKRLMRVISRLVPISNKQAEADQTADLEVMGLNAVRTVAQIAQNSNYTKARLQNYAQLQLIKRLVNASTKQEEAKEVLKSYAVHNFKFEEQIYREQLNEFYNGKNWDETEEEMQVYAEKFVPKESGISEVLSGVTSLFSNWWNTTTTTTTTTNVPSQEIIRRGRTARGDNVSNMLWNMRGANML